MAFASSLKTLVPKHFTRLIRGELHQCWVMILVVVVATWLRTWQINTQAVLFGDAGRDLLAAAEAIKVGQIPLLGIASSIPRFHQGPLTIWAEMLLIGLFGHQTTVITVFFAFISVLAVIAIYELGETYFKRHTGLLAATILAVSPLAIMHGRMPYHTTPIPLMLILYLVALLRLRKGTPRGLFWAVLTWALLVQFELTSLSLGLLIPLVWWRTRRKFTPVAGLQTAAALVIGFLPQIINDLTQPITQNQLGGLTAWVGYRALSLSSMIKSGIPLGVRITQTLTAFGTYLDRIWSVEILFVTLIMLALLVWTAISNYREWRKGKLAFPIQLIWAATILLTLSYFVHGAPGEAYFPPYLVLLPLLIAVGLQQLLRKQAAVVMTGLVILAFTNAVLLYQNNFLVSTTHPWNYGPSVKEQVEIVQTINTVSKGEFVFRTTQPAGRFPAFFDNLRWIALTQNTRESSAQGVPFFIESKQSGLAGFPDITKIQFNTFDVYYY